MGGPWGLGGTIWRQPSGSPVHSHGSVSSGLSCCTGGGVCGGEGTRRGGGALRGGALDFGRSCAAGAFSFGLDRGGQVPATLHSSKTLMETSDASPLSYYFSKNSFRWSGEVTLPVIVVHWVALQPGLRDPQGTS